MSAIERAQNIRQYLIITGNYWAFTLTDGALRMLIVLYFHNLGYAALDIALLFVFYELFGVITNLVGGWLGARLGLNRTMNMGLALQVIALSMLLVPEPQLTVIWVMIAQAFSGIAKDLNKMSAKSAIKSLVPQNSESTLFKWVAILTGSKNALKGAGFFMGGGLLAWIGFQGSIATMTAGLVCVFSLSVILLKGDLGKAKSKPKFTEIFSKSREVNILSAARLFLFGARDIWFVIALPVFMASNLNWNHVEIGGFLAIWIIGYGFVQSIAPTLTRTTRTKLPSGRSAVGWAASLTVIPFAIYMAPALQLPQEWTLIGGLLIFGFFFAINSSLHSYLIVSFAKESGTSLDVGFYYMANAMGRLIGTLFSGWIYQNHGFYLCLIASGVFLIMATITSLWLPRTKK
jgi:MFS transporter, APGE family, 1-arseno-3-phosphoglycerate exporter